MKKIISMIAIISLIVVITACEKQDSFPKGYRITENSEPQFVPSGWGIHRTWYVGPGACSSPATDCYDDVDIPVDAPLNVTPDAYARLVNPAKGNEGAAGGRFITYSQLVNAANRNADAVAKFFNNYDNWSTLFPELGSDKGGNWYNIDYLHKLQSGDYDIAPYYNENNSTMHFLCGNARKNAVTVEHFEFDFPVHISK